MLRAICLMLRQSNNSFYEVGSLNVLRKYFENTFSKLMKIKFKNLTIKSKQN